MTELVFETAAFADVIKKANILAPSTGLAFDKVAGIMLDIDPKGSNGWTTLVRSANLDIYRTEWIDPLEISGDATQWRLPSALFARVVSSLPIGSGKTVTLTEHVSGIQRFVRLVSGRTKARFNLMDETAYPEWHPFDPSLLADAMDLGGRIGMVEWAAAKSMPPLAGVHFTGDLCIATDRYRLAVAPLHVPGTTEPFTVPAGLLSQLLKQTGEVKVGFQGGQFLIMPDDQTQLRCILYGETYPNVLRTTETEYESTIRVRKSAILDIMQRAQSYGSGDRDSALRCFIGEEEFALAIANQEVGMLGDAIELVGQCAHPRWEVMFTPENIIEAIVNSPNEEVDIHYTVDKNRQPVLVDGGSGYRAWVIPRQQMKAEGST